MNSCTIYCVSRLHCITVYLIYYKLFKYEFMSSLLSFCNVKRTLYLDWLAFCMSIIAVFVYFFFFFFLKILSWISIILDFMLKWWGPLQKPDGFLTSSDTFFNYNLIMWFCAITTHYISVCVCVCKITKCFSCNILLWRKRQT